MQGGWHQLKTDWDAVRRTDQMQAPAEELFLFGGAVAAVGASAHLFAAPRAHTATDREWQAINHKDLTRHSNLAQGGGNEGQPVGKFMQAAIKACDINPPGQIASFTQDAHGAF